MTLFRMAAFCAAPVVLMGCVGAPEDYETAPVLLHTEQGTVSCQLYTDEIVAWDRAIGRPASMDVATADALCREAGQRRVDSDE